MSWVQQLRSLHQCKLWALSSARELRPSAVSAGAQNLAAFIILVINKFLISFDTVPAHRCTCLKKKPYKFNYLFEGGKKKKQKSSYNHHELNRSSFTWIKVSYYLQKKKVGKNQLLLATWYYFCHGHSYNYIILGRLVPINVSW